MSRRVGGGPWTSAPASLVRQTAKHGGLRCGRIAPHPSLERGRNAILAGADAVAYSAGFVVATGLLHLAGILFGLLTRWPAGQVAVRAAGVAIAGIGVITLSGLT